MGGTTNDTMKMTQSEPVTLSYALLCPVSPSEQSSEKISTALPAALCALSRAEIIGGQRTGMRALSDVTIRYVRQICAGGGGEEIIRLR